MSVVRPSGRLKWHRYFDRGMFISILFLLTGSFGSALLAFLVQLFLVRILNVPDYGHLVALLATINLLTPISGFGMGWFWLRVFGEEGWGGLRWIAPTIRIVCASSGISLLVLLAYCLMSGTQSLAERMLTSLLLTPVLLGQTLAELTSSRLQLEERYAALAGWQSLTQLGRALVVLAVVCLGFHSTLALLIGYAVVGGAILSMSAMSIRTMSRGQIRLIGHRQDFASAVTGRKIPALKSIIAEATPYCLITVFYLLVSQAVVVMEERLVGREAAAMYNVAFLIVSAVHLIPAAIYSKYLVSKIFRWWEHDRQMFTAAFHLGLVASALLGVACMGSVMILAPFVIPLFFGDKYATAVSILMVLAVIIPVRFVSHSFGAAFFSQENMSRKVWYLGAAGVICVLLNLVLLPRMGVIGGALSSIAAELVVLALYIWGTMRHIDCIDVAATFRAATLRSSLEYIVRSSRQGR